MTTTKIRFSKTLTHKQILNLFGIGAFSVFAWSTANDNKKQNYTLKKNTKKPKYKLKIRNQAFQFHSLFQHTILHTKREIIIQNSYINVQNGAIFYNSIHNRTKRTYAIPLGWIKYFRINDVREFGKIAKSLSFHNRQCLRQGKLQSLEFLQILFFGDHFLKHRKMLCTLIEFCAFPITHWICKQLRIGVCIEKWRIPKKKIGFK